MKNRLVKELSKKSKTEDKDLSLIVRNFLEKKDFESAIKEMGQICKAYFSDSMTTDL